MIPSRLFFHVRRWDLRTASTLSRQRWLQGGSRPVAATWHGPERRRPEFKRFETTLTGDEKSGHIVVSSPLESILFFGNIFPLRLRFLLWRPWPNDGDVTDLLKRFENSSLGIMDPINMVKRAISNTVSIKVTEIIPRLKDGGAFVKFSHEADTTPKAIEEELVKALQQNPVKTWFDPFRGIRAGLVRGVPWLEDLHRLPRSRLRVEFTGPDTPELGQESLFSLFRKYGKIAEITSQPADSKELPRYAYVDFFFLSDAIMARNCMHGYQVHPCSDHPHPIKLRLSYEERLKPHRIWQFVSSHPKIVIPVIAALVAALTVAIFDPIREWFIRVHVQKSFALTNSHIYKWFKRRTSDILAFGKPEGENAGLGALSGHRKDMIDSIRHWLQDTSDTFIVIQGPRGSGKKELVLDQVLKGRANVLVVDCKPIVEARSEASTVKKLANAVGYRPVFSWANNLSSLIDMAVTSTTGVKAGFSETLESQVAKILQATASALKGVSLSGRPKDGEDARLSDDAYLEAHPERRAIVVIDNFFRRNDESTVVYDKMADWAAGLVTSNLAHVIILTTDTGHSKSLAKSLPDRVFHQIALGDLSPEVAKHFVVSHLATTEDATEEDDGQEKQKPQASPGQGRHDLAELDECIDMLGGRLTDLQLLAQRLKTGQSPKKAVADMIEQSASEILRMFLLAPNNDPDGKRKWSTEQAWHLIKHMAARESLRYNEVLLSNTFAASTTSSGPGELALDALQNAELIAVRSANGRPQTVRPGRPVYLAAFRRLVADVVLRARMDLAVLAELAAVEARAIAKCETELATLAILPDRPHQAAARVQYLLDKLQASQAKIAAFEGEMAGLKRILIEEA